MPHVDIVKNDWLAGYQHPVAQVFLEEGKLDLESPEPDTWREVVFRPIPGVDPTQQPAEFLAALSHHIHGTYLFATEPHEDHACPFAKHPLVPISELSRGEREAALGAGA